MVTIEKNLSEDILNIYKNEKLSVIVELDISSNFATLKTMIVELVIKKILGNEALNYLHIMHNGGRKEIEVSITPLKTILETINKG